MGSFLDHVKGRGVGPGYELLGAVLDAAKQAIAYPPRRFEVWRAKICLVVSDGVKVLIVELDMDVDDERAGVCCCLC